MAGNVSLLHTNVVEVFAGATLVDLMTYTIAANTLSGNNKTIRATAWGRYSGTGNLTQVFMVFGVTTILDTTLLIVPNTNWWIQAMVVRTGASAQRAFAVYTCGEANSFNAGTIDCDTEPAEDTTLGITIKCQGDGGAANDVSQRGFIIELLDFS